MPFPTNPTNGQTTTQNGIVYTYNSTLTAWTVGVQSAGNISGNNINITSTAAIGTTLSVTGSTTLASTLAVTGNITGGNVLTGGLISATSTITSGANITGANLSTAGLITATGNITGANLSTAGLITATGNITGGNLLTTGSISATGVIITGGNHSLTGNIVDTGALWIQTGSNGNITLNPNGTGVVISTANTLPSANATFDLGSTTARWKTVFTSDLDLNNGIGDWTIVEGEDDLFLYNNKKGRVFKFALIEVDPATATPKIDGLK